MTHLCGEKKGIEAVGMNLGDLDWATPGLSGKRDTNCHALPMGVGGEVGGRPAAPDSHSSLAIRRRNTLPPLGLADCCLLGKASWTLFCNHAEAPRTVLSSEPRYLTTSGVICVNHKQQSPATDIGGVSLSWFPPT